jgi:predicted aspartyl protease
LLGTLLFCVVALLALDRAAVADDCRPQPRAELGVVLAGNIPLATVGINGAATTFLVDTGAERTILTAAAAKRLRIDSHYEYPRRMQSLHGAVSSGDARLRTVELGGMRLDDFRILVAQVTLPSLAGRSIDGLLGADFLSDYEVDLDLPRNRLTLYQKPSCAMTAPPWAQGFTRIAVNRSLHDRLFFPVSLDGRRLAALFDTGAQLTALDAESAAKLGIGAAVLARDPVAKLRGVASEVVVSRAHRFGRLEIGGESVRDPTIVVTRLGLQDADLMLGADFLRNRRIWLSYAWHQIFLGRSP